MERRYSILYFDTKASFNLSYQEYHYLSMVYSMSTVDGWCVAPNSYFMEYLGISTDRGLQKLTLKLKNRGILIKGKGSRRRVSDEFALSIDGSANKKSEQQDTPNSRTPRTTGHPNSRTGISEQQDGVTRTAVRKNPSHRTPNNNDNNTYSNTYNNSERDFEKKEISDQEKAAPTPELNSDSSKQPAKKEKEKGFAQKEKPSGADLVDWDNAFWQSAEFQWSLSKWFEMMKDQHNKTFYSRDMVVERLRKLHSLLKATNDNRKEEEAVEIIKTATRKGWKDFYKDNNGSNTKQKHTDPHRIKNEIRTEEEEAAHKKKVEESFLEQERIGKLVMEETKELWGL